MSSIVTMHWYPVSANKKEQYTAILNIVAWVNTINHNLDLSDPLWFTIKSVDTTTNNIFSISNYLNITPNSFDFTSPVARNSVHFTIDW